MDVDAWAARTALQLFRDEEFNRALREDTSRTNMKLMARVAAQATSLDEVEILQMYQASRGHFPTAISSRLLDAVQTFGGKAQLGERDEALVRLASLYAQVARLHSVAERREGRRR